MAITTEQYKALKERVEKGRSSSMLGEVVKATPRKPKPERPRPGYVEAGPDIVVPIAPCPAPRQVRSDVWRPSKAVLRYRSWKDSVRPFIEKSGWRLGNTLNVHFVMPMPPSWSDKKRAEMDGRPHQQKPDIDNLVKALCDFDGGDDSHMHTLTAKKTWGVNGRMVIIRTLQPQ